MEAKNSLRQNPKRTTIELSESTRKLLRNLRAKLISELDTEASYEDAIIYLLLERILGREDMRKFLVACLNADHDPDLDTSELRAALNLALDLVMHGPPQPDPEQFMQRLADHLTSGYINEFRNSTGFDVPPEDPEHIKERFLDLLDKLAGAGKSSLWEI